MKKNTKKIICLILSLVLILGVIISSTSCLYTFEILTEGTGSSDNKKDPEKDDNKSEGTSGTENGGQSSISGGLQFCPGTNDTSEIDNLCPEARALLSVVAIDAKLDLQTSYPYYDSSATTEYTSYGSGIIYSLDRNKGDAYIITNYHVVYNKDEVAPGGFSDGISLYLYGMSEPQYAIPAKIIGGSMTYDIAVLKVEGSQVLKNSMACAASLGDSESVRINDDVLVIGNPEGYGISVTEGIVSVESESLAMTGADGRTALNLRVMRVSAAINDGNSGGGLYSSDGELLGVVNAKRTGAEVDNIGYAIPINLAKNLADNIIKNCDGVTNTSLKKCVIGITLDAISSGLVSDSEGNLVIRKQIAVKSLTDSCITDKILVGDIINSITVDGNKTDVTRTHHVIDSMLLADVGSTVILNITRGTNTFDVTLVIPSSALTTVK